MKPVLNWVDPKAVTFTNLLRDAGCASGHFLLLLVVAPLLWLLSLPFRLVGLCVQAVFAFLRAVLFLPVRLLGYRA